MHNTDTLQDTMPSRHRSVEQVVYAREQHRIIMDLQEGSCDKTSFVLLRVVWISVPTFGTGTFAVESPAT